MKNHVEHPMEPVLDMPVTAHGVGKQLASSGMDER